MHRLYGPFGNPSFQAGPRKIFHQFSSLDHIGIDLVVYLLHAREFNLGIAQVACWSKFKRNRSIKPHQVEVEVSSQEVDLPRN